MAHEIHDYKATAATLDRLAKHPEEWPAAPSEE
jgi:hypothetical protein